MGRQWYLPDAEVTICVLGALLAPGGSSRPPGRDELAKPDVELPVDKAFPEIVINPSRYSGQPTFVKRRRR